MKKSDLPIHKLFVYNEQCNIISTTGIQEVINLLGHELNKGTPPLVYQIYNPNVGNVWLDGATYPKRVKKWLHDVWHKELSNDLLKAIGDIAHCNMEKGGRYAFDFDDELDWDAGQFGDEDSCFWGDRYEDREKLIEYGAMAIRFYHSSICEQLKEGSNTSNYAEYGYGRSWLVFPNKKHIVQDKDGKDLQQRDFCVLFNAYPDRLDRHTQSRVMAGKLGLAYSSCYLSIHYPGDLIWINGRDFLIGDEFYAPEYAIGEKETVENIYRVDMKI